MPPGAPNEYRMEMKKRTWFSIAGSFIALMAGSGVVTGQELLQYYVPYGSRMWVTAAVIGGVLLLAVYAFAYAGSRGAEDAFVFYFGTLPGRILSGYAAVVCFLSYAMMIAAGSAAVGEQFGAPSWVGAMGITVLTVLAVLAGLQRFLRMLRPLGVVLLGILQLMALYALIKAGGDLSRGMTLLRGGAVTRPSLGPLAAGIGCGGFCLLWLPRLSVTLGQERGAGSVAAGAGVGIGLVLVGNMLLSLALIAGLPDTARRQIPNLILAYRLYAPLAAWFGGLICLAIFNSATPLLWTVVSTLPQRRGMRIPFTLVLAGAACALALNVPFDRLMRHTYTINGWFGAALLAAMLLSLLQKRREKHGSTH